MFLAPPLEAHRGRGAAAPGGAGGAVPTNVQVIVQGQTVYNGSNMSVGAQMGTHSSFNVGSASGIATGTQQVGWHSVGGATSYNIYRSTNGGSYSLLANVVAATAASNYTSYVSLVTGRSCNSIISSGACVVAGGIDSAYTDTTATNNTTATEFLPTNLTGSLTSGLNVINITAVNNVLSTGTTQNVQAGMGIGGPGIPIGATIATFGSGGTSGTGTTGTYQMSVNATANETGQTYGTVYFPRNGYTYQVTQVTGGVESSAATAILPFIENGQFIMTGGPFNGVGAMAATPPATTPLGFSQAFQWQGSGANSILNSASGWGSASQQLGVAGYNYINVSVYTTSSGAQITADTEIVGDNNIVGTAALSSLCTGPSTVTSNTWVTYKCPLTSWNVDTLWSGSGVLQGTYYKTTLQYNSGIGNVNFYLEIYFSVN